MSKIAIALLDETRCEAHHIPSQTRLVTDVTPELGGGETSFSSTDLVAVALGTCIGSSLSPVAKREGLPLDGFQIVVDKTLVTRPRRIGKLSVQINLPPGLTEIQRKKLINAAHTCMVHRSLKDSIEIDIEFADMPA